MLGMRGKNAVWDFYIKGEVTKDDGRTLSGGKTEQVPICSMKAHLEDVIN